MTGASDAVLRTMVKNGLLEQFQEERFRAPVFEQIMPEPPKTLNERQQQVYEEIRVLLESHAPAAALLHGVTGSGKTQVYLKLIDDMLADGRSAIVLVPEIGLTPQFIRVFVARFGDTVSVLHSALSAGERYDSWKKIKSGAARVVIGTRSAAFAPVQELGLIVMDEEQDGAYQSDRSPRYHARVFAKFRAAQQNALLLMGSATPSVESYFGAKNGKYPLFSLPERFGGGGLPQVLIADMRGLSRQGLTGSIGPVLHAELKKNLANGEQSILFLNRRGANRVIGCCRLRLDAGMSVVFDNDDLSFGEWTRHVSLLRGIYSRAGLLRRVREAITRLWKIRGRSVSRKSCMRCFRQRGYFAWMRIQPLQKMLTNSCFPPLARARRISCSEPRW